MDAFPIRKLALAVGTEMKGGMAPGPYLQAELGTLTGSYVAIVEGVLAEMRRSRPNRPTLAGFSYAAGAVLLRLNTRATAGESRAKHAIDAVARRILRAVQTEAPGIETLLAISRAYAIAGLDPGGPFHFALAQALRASLRR